MKLESLINEAYNEECSVLEFDDFVTVCTEASRYISSKLQTRNVINVLEDGFEDEYIKFYINKYIENNHLFEKYNIRINLFEDYLEYGKRKEKYPVIRTEITFPVNLLFEKQTSLKRAKN